MNCTISRKLLGVFDGGTTELSSDYMQKSAKLIVDGCCKILKVPFLERFRVVYTAIIKRGLRNSQNSIYKNDGFFQDGVTFSKMTSETDPYKR